MSQSHDVVVGIDLGTTNSAVAVVRDGVPEVLPVDGRPLLPSVVGLDPSGQLLIGQPARNQMRLFPERTIRSIKRKMGEDVEITLGDQSFTPVELSAMILRKLKAAAEEAVQGPVTRAVITVPAFFTDAQRVATREAGEVAGFTVERIINEPTAAALCYSSLSDATPDAIDLVYDLGGGTFDVSIVKIQGDVTQVLSSHGDTHLGGDDLDERLVEYLCQHIQTEYDVDPTQELRAMVRLQEAAEDAKIALSTDSYTTILEENLLERDGVGIHLNQELSRPEFEDLTRSLLERTRHSVQVALRGAKLELNQIDNILLVGGSTRIPLVSEILHNQLGKQPRRDVDPDTAVVLGAALQGARIAGQSAHILVDVSPFSFGTSHLGLLDGEPSTDCYTAIVHRNTPLPTRQSHIFYTVAQGQEEIEVKIFQGEAKDARKNLLLGTFDVKGLDPRAPESSPILFELQLDLDGILHVEVSEHHTGLRKKVTIRDAFRKLSEDALAQAQKRLSGYFAEDGVWESEPVEESPTPTAHTLEASSRFAIPTQKDEEIPEEHRTAWYSAAALLQKAETMLPTLEDMDREEVDELAVALHQAMMEPSFDKLASLSSELSDVLFYLE